MNAFNPQKLTIDSAPITIVDGDRGVLYPKKTDYFDQGFCLILNTGNVTTTGFSFENCQFISEAKDSELRKGKLIRDDVVLTTRGTIGNSAYFGDSVEFENVRINSSMVILRANKDLLLPKYLYLYLRSKEFSDEVERLRSGAAQPQLPIRDLKQASIAVPPLSDQEKIVEVIWLYDDLIKANCRQIALLEESALLLYREWFVNLRLPGCELKSLGQELPEGWVRKNLYDIADLTMGFPFQAALFNSDGVGKKAIRIRDIQNIESNTWTTENPSSLEYEVVRGDFLIGMDGIFHMNHWAGEAGWLVQRVCRVRAKSDLYQAYIAQALYQPIKNLEASISGATVAHLGAKHLKAIELLIPPQDFFGELTLLNDLLQQKIILIEQNKVLQETRNTLLPQLMSGAIQV